MTANMTKPMITAIMINIIGSTMVVILDNEISLS